MPLTNGNWIVIEERDTPSHLFALLLQRVSGGVVVESFEVGEEGTLRQAVWRAAGLNDGTQFNIRGSFLTTTPE